MTKQEKIAAFNPSGVGLKNGNFIGLPFTRDDAAVILFPVPWDVTVSYNDGTSTAAENILEASSQLDLFDSDVEDAWKIGIFFESIDELILKQNVSLRKKSRKYISFLENGGKIEDSPGISKVLQEVNVGCQKMVEWTYEKIKNLLSQGKLIGLIGGDHSTPLGYIKAISEQYETFGILHLDAHFDLRQAYEGFQYSHASVFYNALEIKNLTQVVSVGIRDFCQEEVDLIALDKRMLPYYDWQLKEELFSGKTWKSICDKIVASLPENVYISFDIDGLNPNLCPATGTPVPGGLQLEEAFFLIKTLVKSGRKIIGFDVVEVAGKGNEWDGNVAARLIYKLSNLMAYSNGITP